MQTKRCLLSGLAFAGILVILLLLNYIPEQNVYFEVKSSRPDEYQFFYAESIEDFNEENSEKQTLSETAETKLSHDLKNDCYLRVDMGLNGTYELSDLKIKTLFSEIYFGEKEIVLTNDLTCVCEENTLHITSMEGDPYLVFDLSEISASNRKEASRIMFVIHMILAGAIAIWVYIQYEHIKLLMWWTIDILKNFSLIFELAVSDFKTRYASSYLGMIWAFIQPIVTVVIYVIVFGYGLKTTPVKDFPFVLWLVAGIVPWFYFSDAIMTATNSLKEYSYLVKKVVFEVKILPLVKIMAALLIHLFFLLVAIVLYVANGYVPDIYYLQLIYYMFCCTLLCLGLSYLTSALNVFVPDLSQVINIMLQFGMWMTPIMWSSTMFGSRIEKIIRINPLYYIVEGYRDCFYNHVAFWEKPGLTIYFWFVTVCCLILGMYSFRKLERHFADVL